MTKTKRFISIIMVLTMLLSICSLFTVNASAATVQTGKINTKYGVTAKFGETQYYRYTVTTYGTKITLKLNDSWSGTKTSSSGSEIMAYVREYARFTICVNGSNGYSKTYFDCRIDDKITLPQKWGCKYTVTVSSYYLHGRLVDGVVKSNAIVNGRYYLSK